MGKYIDPEKVRHYMAEMVAGDINRCICWRPWPCEWRS